MKKVSTWHEMAVEAVSYMNSGRTEEAKRLLYRSISLGPTESWPYLKLAEIVEDVDESIRLVEATKNIEPSEWYHFALIKLYEKKQKQISEKIRSLQSEFSQCEFKKSSSPYLKAFSSVDKNHPSLIGDTSRFFQTIDFSKIRNSLECLSLLITGNELNDGTYLKLLSSLDRSIDNDIARDLSLYIFVNERNTELFRTDILRKLGRLFQCLEIVDLNIPKEMDVYIKSAVPQEMRDVPLHGFKSGPNLAFFKAIEKLSDYNTTLFLECDCVLNKGWMKKISNYCFSQPFLISGSHYDGINDELYSDLINSHINGGVALYATGNKVLQQFVRYCHELSPFYAKHYDPFLPYDYLLKLVIEHHFNNEEKIENKEIWTYIKKHYVFTTLILNHSSQSEFDVSRNIDAINETYDCALIHKKHFDS